MGSKLKVALLFGGKSGEHEVSIVSATSVYKALDKSKYEVTLIGIDKNGRWLLPEDTQLLANTTNPRLIKLNNENHQVAISPSSSNQPLVSLKGNQPTPHQFDVVVPILHGTNGEDGTMQGMLELMQIPYVGSGVLGSSVGMDKDVSKRLFREAGIPVVPALTFRRHDYQKNPEAMIQKCADEFGWPFFIKPANSGSSVGVHKVKTAADARKQFDDAFSFDIKILAEKAVAARELEVAVLGNHEPKASIVGEIVPTHEFYSYDAKYIDENGADLNIPAKNVSPEQTALIQKYAIDAFKTLELRGLARVDFFLDKNDGKLYLNEVNTIPGFTSISMYPKLWAASGVAYPDLLDRLIELAREIHTERKNLKTSY